MSMSPHFDAACHCWLKIKAFLFPKKVHEPPLGDEDFSGILGCGEAGHPRNRTGLLLLLCR